MINKTTYKALLFDVDKTLTNSKKEITVTTKQALKMLSDKGFTIGACTGRQFVTLQSLLPEMFSNSSLHICADGAQIIDTQGNVHFENNISEPISKSICDLAEKYDCRAVLQQGNTLYGNTKALAHVSSSTLAGANQIQKRPLTEIQVWSIPIIVVVGDSLEFLEGLSKLPVSYKKMVNYVGEQYVDITAQGVNKSSGILEWCRITGIQASEIIGFGDSENDVEFLQTVGYAVAMGNATQEVQSIADEVTDDCDHDGVAHWIEKNIPSSR